MFLVGNPGGLIQDQVLEAAGFGPEWQVNWTGAEPFDALQHLCTCIYGADGTYTSQWVRAPYAPAGPPRAQAANWERCPVAWVRAL